MCVTEWGLVLIHKCFFTDKSKEHFFFFVAILEEIKRSEKRIRRMKRVKNGSNGGDTITDIFMKS